MSSADPSEVNPYAAPRSDLGPGAAPRRDGLAADGGFWRRFAASVIDTLVIAALGVFLLLVTGFVLGLYAGLTGRPPQLRAEGATDWAFLTPWLLVPLLYFAFLESSPWQATLGKLALGVRVVDRTGGRISLPRAALRTLAKILSAPTLLGVLPIAGYAPDRRKRALHDLIAGTYVVRTD